MIRNVVVGRLRMAADPDQQAADAAAYQVYDADEGHNRLRREFSSR